MLRKEMYTWFLCVLYTRQAEADFYINQLIAPSQAPRSNPHTLFGVLLIHATHPSLPLT